MTQQGPVYYIYPMEFKHSQHMALMHIDPVIEV